MAQIQIDSESLALLDATATASSFSREEALKEAIINYSEYDRWFRKRVASGIREADEGKLLSSEEVDRRAQARIRRLQGNDGC